MTDCGHLLCELIDHTAPPFGGAAGRGAPTVDHTAPPFGGAAGRGAPTVDRSCSLATGRSRGCRPNLGSRTVAPDVVEEVRALVAVIDPDARDERVRKAAVRLAEIMRREAREDRPVLAYVRVEEPEFAPALARLCLRRR